MNALSLQKVFLKFPTLDVSHFLSVYLYSLLLKEIMHSQGCAHPPARSQQAKPARVWHQGAERGGNMKRQICLDYLKGKCNANRWHCKYAHPLLGEDMSLIKPAAGQRNVCHIWALTGYCKFGPNCRYAHPDLDMQCEPKITPPQQHRKLKHAPEMHIDRGLRTEPTSLHLNEYHGTIEVRSPMTPMTPMTPLTPLTPGSDLRQMSGFSWGQMSGCVEDCSAEVMMKFNRILERLTVANLGPLCRDLLKLMDVNPVMTPLKVVSLVFDKAINERKAMASLYVELCRQLFELFALNASYMFELIHAFLLASFSQPAEDEETQLITRTRQIGALNVMVELYNKGMIDNQQISLVITWLIHNTQQAEDEAMAALSEELLCSVLTSTDQPLQSPHPTEHSQYSHGSMSVMSGHSERLQVLDTNVCALPPVDTPQVAAVHVHCPYA